MSDKLTEVFTQAANTMVALSVRKMELEAELEAANKRIAELEANLAEAKSQAEESSDVIAFMQSEIMKIPCCHNPHPITPPMMVREQVMCIVKHHLNEQAARVKGEA